MKISNNVEESLMVTGNQNVQSKICMFSMGKLFEKQTGGKRRFIELYHSLISNGYTVELYSADSATILKKNGILSGVTINSNEKKKGILNIPSLNVLLGNKKCLKEIKKQNYRWVIVFDVVSAITPCIYRVPNVYLYFRQDMIEYRRLAYRDSGMKPLKRSVLMFLGKVAERICISRAKLMVSQCKCDVENLKKRHPLMSRMIDKKMVIQINNINPSWVQKFDMSIDKGEKKYDIIFIGNFKDSRKGHALLLEALDDLAKEGYCYKTIIIGDGKQLEVYKDKYAHLKNVYFLGRISAPSDLIRASQLMIVPSYADSCPNTVLEALYYGVPVLGANAGGVPEILNNPAWCFELTVEDLSMHIKNIFRQDGLEQLLYEQQRRREELTFDWGRCVIDIMEGRL